MGKELQPTIDVDAVIQRLTGEIHRLEALAAENLSASLRYKAEVGMRLLAARSAFRKRPGWRGKNEWEDWGSREFSYSPRVMNRTVWLYRNAPKLADFGPIHTYQAALAALMGQKQLPAAKDEKLAGLILTGHVPAELWDGEGEPPVAALVAACTDWRVRRG